MIKRFSAEALEWFKANHSLGRFEVKAESVDGQDQKVIYLYDAIVSSEVEENRGWGVSAERIIAEIKMAEMPILLRINSPGGDIGAAMGIIAAINECKQPLAGVIDGGAYSAAAFIACSLPRCDIYSFAKMMIHQSWTYIGGNADDLRKEAQVLDLFDQSQIDFYHNSFKRRGSGEEPKWIERMRLEDWMTADQAKAAGLVDNIIKLKDDQEAKARANQIKWNLSLFKNAPTESPSASSGEPAPPPSEPITPPAEPVDDPAKAEDEAALKAEQEKIAAMALAKRQQEIVKDNEFFTRLKLGTLNGD